MSTTPRFPRALLRLLLLGGLVLGGACGGGSQEEQLAEASETLQEARQRVADALGRVEERRAEVEAAKKALAEAQRELAQAEEKLAKAESQVDLKATDAALFRAVQKRLLEAKELRSVAIDADVEKGVVRLRGRVPDQETADRAVEIARGVPGVARVENRISVAREQIEAEEGP